MSSLTVTERRSEVAAVLTELVCVGQLSREEVTPSCRSTGWLMVAAVRCGSRGSRKHVNAVQANRRVRGRGIVTEENVESCSQ